MKLLAEENVSFRQVDYFTQPFSAESLSALLTKAGLGPRDVLRKRAPQYKGMGLANATLNDADLVAAIVDQPDLLERPLVERGGRAVLARPPERVRELF